MNFWFVCASEAGSALAAVNGIRALGLQRNLQPPPAAVIYYISLGLFSRLGRQRDLPSGCRGTSSRRLRRRSGTWPIGWCGHVPCRYGRVTG